MNEQNEKLVKRWHDEGINQQNADLALELCAENFQFHFAFITSDSNLLGHVIIIDNLVKIIRGL
jgi:hypothetical protein